MTLTATGGNLFHTQPSCLPAVPSSISIMQSLNPLSSFQHVRGTIQTPASRSSALSACPVSEPSVPSRGVLHLVEWPACAAIRCACPGLPICTSPYVKCDEVEIISGFNMLGSIPPQISTLQIGYCPERSSFLRYGCGVLRPSIRCSSWTREMVFVVQYTSYPAKTISYSRRTSGALVWT